MHASYHVGRHRVGLCASIASQECLVLWYGRCRLSEGVAPDPFAVLQSLNLVRRWRGQFAGEVIGQAVEIAIAEVGQAHPPPPPRPAPSGDPTSPAWAGFP